MLKQFINDLLFDTEIEKKIIINLLTESLLFMQNSVVKTTIKIKLFRI